MQYSSSFLARHSTQVVSPLLTHSDQGVCMPVTRLNLWHEQSLTWMA